LRLSDAAERWQVALIGKNLTEEYYWSRNSDAPFQGTAAGAVPGVLADSISSVSRGREIRLQLAYNFGS
jgi:iron complex outermembrane recepter protein